MLKRPWFSSAVFFFALCAAFGARCVRGFHFLPFGDESVQLLGARALRAGDVLYRDFIDAHGPLSFIVAQAYGSLFGWKEPLDARRAIAGLTVLAAACVVTSPMLRSKASRLWAGGLFLGLLAEPWLIHALNMVNYYVIGGALMVPALAWVVFPALVGATVLRWRAFVGGMCMAWLCADAYSLAPSAILIGAGTALLLLGGPAGCGGRRVMVAATAGFTAGGALILAWMLRFGDLLGYLTFHIIDMQVNYSRYIPFGWRVALDGFRPSFSPIGIVHSLIVILFEVSVVLSCLEKPLAPPRRPGLRWLGFAVIVFAVFMLNFRGAFGFNDASFLVASVAMFALAVPAAFDRLNCAAFAWRSWSATAALSLLVAGLEWADRTAVLAPFGDPYPVYSKYGPSALKVNMTLPVVQRIRGVLRPGERLMVLEYDPSFYLIAGVLPVRKFDLYLPWDADYGRAPWFGMKRDLCEELSERLPPVIYYEKWKVWDKYPAESFMPCLQGVLDRSYVADKVPQLFIRRDRFVAG
jgi:hypothetical protein